MTDQNLQETANSETDTIPVFIQWNDPVSWPDWFRKAVNIIFVLFMGMNIVFFFCALYGLSVALVNVDMPQWMVLCIIVALGLQFGEMVGISILYVRLHVKAIIGEKPACANGGGA